jgi:hypothetical protein
MVTTVAVAEMMELLLSVALRQSLENKVSQWTSFKFSDRSATGCVFTKE